MGIYSSLRSPGYSQSVDMWGALAFLVMFLMIGRTTREFILSFLDHLQLRLAVEAPLSYFLIILITGSAVLSALIMAFWPKTQDEKKQIVTRQYLGPTDGELRLTPPEVQPLVPSALDVTSPRWHARVPRTWETWPRDLDARAAFRRVVGTSQRFLAWISQ